MVALLAKTDHFGLKIQTLEMIELSRAKGSKLRNDRAELSSSSSRLLA
jgi:hypothetical protein